jgi:hypothetical protein
MSMSPPDESPPSAAVPDTTCQGQPHDPDARLLDELTDGYAYALALDAECLRLLRRITALVAEGAPPSGDELGRLSRRLRDAQRELAEHRQRLMQLRTEAFRDGVTLRRRRQLGMASATNDLDGEEP